MVVCGPRVVRRRIGHYLGHADSPGQSDPVVIPTTGADGIVGVVAGMAAEPRDELVDEGGGVDDTSPVEETSVFSAATGGEADIAVGAEEWSDAEVGGVSTDRPIGTDGLIVGIIALLKIGHSHASISSDREGRLRDVNTTRITAEDR